MLLIHVKDHNNLGRSTPLGRVQIPLEDLCHASAQSTSIASTAQKKRYPLTPEPWMKKHAQDLGELCIKTEVVGDATVLAEMLQRQSKSSPEKMLSFLSFSSFTSDPYMQGSHLSEDLSSGNGSELFPEYEDEVTEMLVRGQEIRTATAIGNTAKWRKEKFQLSLSYPGMFSDSKTDRIEHYTLHLRIHSARGLVGALSESASKQPKQAADDEPDEFQSYHRRHRRAGTTNAYFTIIPVLGNGELAHGEKKQSLTVYGTRHPCWPEQEFVFGKAKDIATISHLSLHVYSRNLLDDGVKSHSLLLDEKERSQVVWLKRYQLLKLDASGEVSGDDFEVLRYDQRVLALRKCQNGGRYFPARVLRYYPFPRDEYQVLFEGAVESIEDIRNMFSLDVKGKIKAIRPDGNADVVLLEPDEVGGDGYARNVSASLLTPVQAFTPMVKKLLAKPAQSGSAEGSRWDPLVHSISALKMEVLSAADLPKGIERPGCFVTLAGNPRVATTTTGTKVVTVQQDGTLTVLKDIPELEWEAERPFSLPINHCSESSDVTALQYFENRSIVFGNVHEEDTSASERETLSESQQEIVDAGAAILAHVSSIVIRVVDQGTDSAPMPSHPTIGFAKIDLAGLRDGEQLVHVKLTPPEATPYYKFVGAVNLHILTAKHSDSVFSPVSKDRGPVSAEKEVAVCGFSEWFERREAATAPSSLLTAPTQTLSRIERRTLLRSSLTPTENAQVDAFHTVLAIIAKRIVSILREIQLFEECEALASDEMATFRHVHTTSADPTSEWIGRLIHEMTVETRRDIVLHLEMELLDLAASDAERVYPAPDLDRDEWVKLRAVRQKALQDAGGFFTQDRTSALVLSYPTCFTGEGMVSWILRAPSVLWDDQWTKYCHDALVKATCVLKWRDDKLAQDPDAIQPPRSREHALMWLAALSDAGYMENITSSGLATGASKSHYVAEDRGDRYYRLLEVERWIAKQSRAESLFPLDLVQEIDCYQQRCSPVLSDTTSVSVKAAGEAASGLDQRQTFAKKLTRHVGGLLGTKNSLSTLLLSPELKPPALLKSVIKKTTELIDNDVLYDWKYCLFLPSTRTLYMYEAETSSLPFAVVDMNSTACRAAYTATSGWFEITNGTIFVHDPASRRLVPITDEQRESMLVVRKNGSEALELKAADAQVWVQALAQAGVAMDMRTGQLVVVKQLNAVVVQQKCIEFETEFQPTDLEGSFQRLLNRFFRHHIDMTHRDYEEKLRAFRSKLRGELKKTGRLGDTVLAYFGKGKRLNPKPTRPDNFTRDALYSGRIVRVRTPYTDSKYHVKALYDRSDKSDVPVEMETLLRKYDVSGKADWLRLPKTLRDVFLLYDIEYRHSNETTIEEGMLREHFRAADGDLDPEKVEEGCTDLNLVFKPYDLEDCVTRMSLHCNGRKPLGCLKIPIKMVSHHRVFDAWYPLAPENDMVQKTHLGQVRVQLRLQQISQLVRSKKVPAMLEEIKDAVAKRNLLQPLSSSPMKLLKGAVTPRSRRNVTLPSGSSGGGFSRERSFITVSILEARKLLPSDLLRRDPFVRIDLVHETNGREEFTSMKADVKSKTVNPKWANQEFTLGKTEKSLLSDKKAILLRVLDENMMLGEVPLGFARVELQRDRSGFITGLTLVHADAHGSPTVCALNLDQHNKVQVDAMLLGDEKLRQDKLARARENDPVVDGRLGKLRFAIELIKNENFVEMAEGSSPTKGQGLRTMSTASVETKYSVELKIKNVVPAGSSATDGVEDALDWKQYLCVFQPHGEGGQRVLYDPQSEDLVPGSRNRLSDLLQHSRGSSSAVSSASGSLHDSSMSGSSKFLGKTYDVSKIAYFDVQVTSDALGKMFRGKFGQREILKRPDECASFLNEVIVLKERDSSAELHMTVDIALVGIHRAERVKRVLAETFRLVGMPFDVKTMLHHGSGTSRQPLQSESVQSFLWEVFKVSSYPGRNVSPELLAQAHRMSHSMKLHWRYTPQLLCYLFEHVFNSGEKDLLTYRDAAAIDSVLNRWSDILARVSDAKTQLIGHLHGRETPQLVHALFTNCDWKGFEFASLNDAKTPSDTEATEDPRQSSPESEGEIVLRPGERVHVSLPLCKHAGVAVDVRLRSGQFVAGTIIREYGDDSFDVAFCTAAKVRDESDEYFSDDDELPPLTVGQTVFVCPLARAGSADSSSVWNHSHSMEPGRVGTLAERDAINHNKSPYRVVYSDDQEPGEEWISRVCLDSIFTRIIDSDMHRQLAREDLVRVVTASSSSEASPSGASRPAKVAKNHSNARYRVEYLDGQLPAADSHVTRDLIQPLVEHAMYEGEVVRAYRAPTSNGTSLVVKYDVQLSNGSVADEITRDQLRVKADKFVTDGYLLGSAFASELELGDPNDDLAVDLSNLWGPNNIVKVYLTLPTPVASVQLRDSVTNKLLQTKLQERSAAKPRFIDQCHGFVHGRDLKDDEAKLAQLHAAAVVQRRHHNLSNAAGTEAFDVTNCLCVLLAPQPRVELHGTIRLSAPPESLGLFRSVLSLALKSPAAFAELIQKTLRSAASAKLPLNRKERVLSIETVTVTFDKKAATNVTLNALGTACDGDLVVEHSKCSLKRESVSLKRVGLQVRFHLTVPHNNRGSLVDAVTVAYQDARLALDVLAACAALYLADTSPYTTTADAVEAGEGAWVLDRTEALGDTADPSRRLAVEVLNLAATKGSQPSISLELVPLDDLRLSVRDMSGTVHEVYLPAERLLLEARLRRAVGPFRPARVENGPQFLDADHPKQRQVRKPAGTVPGSLNDESPTVPPYFHVQFTDGDAKAGVESDFVAQNDVKFDVLRVHVVQVSQMFTAGTSSSTTNLTAKVMLVSCDANAAGSRTHALPHGVVLTLSGEICVDMAQNKYPEKSSVILARDRDSCVWTQPTKSAPRVITFGHPGIDLERVSAIRVVLVDGRTGSAIVGTVCIPMTNVARKPVWSKKEFDRAMNKDLASGACDSHTTYSIERTENGRRVVVGKITLDMERSHRPSKNDAVLVKTCSDPWLIDSYELLVATRTHSENTLTRGLLAAGSSVAHGGRTRLVDPTEKEVQLRKIANVMMIAHAMESIYATTPTPVALGSLDELEIRHKDQLKSPRAMTQLKHALSHTKWVVEDTAAALGIKSLGRRLPWSTDPTHTDTDAKKRSDHVVVHANIATSTLRLRRTILKLYHMYRYRLTPTLQKLYELDAKGDSFALADDEKVLRFFEDEVDDLDEDDQAVFRRVYQRLRLAKLCQVLDDILCTTLRVKIMDQNANEHDLVGLAQIPLVDLIDQQERCNAYNLTKPNRGFHANALRIENLVDLGLQAAKNDVKKHGHVVLRLRLTYSSSALLEQAINVYKFLKAKYIMQHETARRRINAAVVPAQRRRWTTVQANLDELLRQASGKLHWQRTPLLLSLIWDIFASSPHKTATLRSNADSDTLPVLVAKVEEYRAAVVRVQNRWANIQPMLDELLVVQAAPQIHAQRTEELLQTIDDNVEGLDVVLGTAWQQVHYKWTTLKAALEELVTMKEKNKIHLGRAPQLLKRVSTTCSKGLNARHADAVANVQFRWMAITQSNGPLSELRLMEKTGLHWRRTHELVLLLNEQCEGFADVDAKALDVVECRWKQVQEWLDDVLGMHHDHKIDCEATPFILKKLHMLESNNTKLRAAGSKQTSTLLQPRTASPSKRDAAAAAGNASTKPSTPRGKLGGRSGNAPPSPSKNDAASSPSTVPLDTAEVDAGRLEGLIEWYAIEEARYELERIPTHRLTSDADRSNWLPFSQDGKDTRLTITQEEMAFTPTNVRAALEDRGVIPTFSSFVPRLDTFAVAMAATDDRGASTLTSSTLPKDLLAEIAELEHAVAAFDDDTGRHQVLANPERFAELSSVVENLGKTDLLWKIDHVVNTNKELEVPTNFVRLLDEMKMRQIPTSDIENVVRTLTVVLQKEELHKVGVDVPSTANFTTVLSLMHRHQVKDVSLPTNASAIQALLHERGMDRRGEPVYLRGMRIGTRPVLSDDPDLGLTSEDARSAMTTAFGKLNTGLGLVDTHIELLRKALLFEALRKRNSLIKTFPGETHVLSEEDLTECTEVDMSGDYVTLIERFQQLLVHESYTKRLASYAALDRCMRALLRVSRDAVVTKEDIAIALQAVGRQHRLPLEAFTRGEILDAARSGKIRSPTEVMLRRCPHVKNAKAMAYYAAVSHAAMVYQETTSFSSRFDPVASRFQDALPFADKSSVDGLVLPKDRSRMNLKAHLMDWLLGSEDTVVRIQRQLGAYHQQRLVWASAAATLGNRWFQRGFGWCDAATNGVGVKALLNKLLVFEAANKMHMVHTEALLREVNDKCTNLRARDKAAKTALEQRYAINLETLEKLVGHAERCINNRRLHSEDTPAMLHALEQACEVPAGLSARHMEAYHIVTSHWIPHRARLDELVKMHKEGTFSIQRTPELLDAMEHHTVGLAGAREIDEASVYASVNHETSGNQQELLERKIDEIRRGQHKTPSSLRLDLGTTTTHDNEQAETTHAWKALSPSKPMVEPLSPREKQTSWRVVTDDPASAAGSSATKQSVVLEGKLAPSGSTSPRRKSSLGDELKEMLKASTKWLLPSEPTTERVRPELFFPQAVAHDSSFVSETPRES